MRHGVTHSLQYVEGVLASCRMLCGMRDRRFACPALVHLLIRLPNQEQGFILVPYFHQDEFWAAVSKAARCSLSPTAKTKMPNGAVRVHSVTTLSASGRACVALLTLLTGRRVYIVSRIRVLLLFVGADVWTMAEWRLIRGSLKGFLLPSRIGSKEPVVINGPRPVLQRSQWPLSAEIGSYLPVA